MNIYQKFLHQMRRIPRNAWICMGIIFLFCTVLVLICCRNPVKGTWEIDSQIFTFAGNGTVKTPYSENAYSYQVQKNIITIEDTSGNIFQYSCIRKNEELTLTDIFSGESMILKKV